MQFSDLVQRLGISPSATSLEVCPSLNPDLLGIAAIDQAQTGSISFIDGDRFSEHIHQTQASALILPPNPTLQAVATDRKMAWLSAEHPRLCFAEALSHFYQPWQPDPAIDKTAVIHPSAVVGEAISVGAHVVIHAGVKIGEGVCLHANVVIYPEAYIGDRTVVHANCTIHERSQIGQDCVIHSGAVIGAEGFGFVPTQTGWVKMPQSGVTVLEDRVEVGCNTTIDRPAVGETRIGQGTKIDNLVQIAHGCQIGPGCVLVGQVGLAGHVELGPGVVLGGQVGVADYLKVGGGAIATAQAGITKNIAANEMVSGYPAMPTQQWLKMMAALRKLPTLLSKMRP
ncbi:MAG: UDP-3-O-(3-hydroxymyristoyl)glucosamine N-acyltransferase [Thermosynechococcaceae cyanobacterium]